MALSRLQTLKQAPSGERFQRYYHAYHSNRGFSWQALLLVFSALISFVVGVILLFIPGPGFVFLLLAGALMSQESLTVARYTDRAEVFILSVGERLRYWWQRNTKS